ncbi:adenylyltransferase/cytidyltransferase family protein [Sphingobacterium sp. lm-10]|uniref:adenylyltransferase/cytidyltransferase family protein n=1 Tax=Sphingobacterium sp. lm-10 TaxID=2944904 RepID=UPI0020208591|nr:adenylyltransferase/cytidyltransferase family protein [Sphingobacterium sp. lm-10]MCL7987002.1 adenylyltransferase/cytidyltransferase family protein [Sphingobacterium sp. lm-10]
MRIGITFGAFDMLHAGQIVFLAEARKKCDYLIVGLCTDGQVDAARKSKPVQSIVERFIQLEGSPSVDEIIPFENDDDLMDLLQTISVDVRFVGSEYENVPFTGKDYCDEAGIAVCFINRAHRFSARSLRKIVAEKQAAKLMS